MTFLVIGLVAMTVGTFLYLAAWSAYLAADPAAFSYQYFETALSFDGKGATLPAPSNAMSVEALCGAALLAIGLFITYSTAFIHLGLSSKRSLLIRAFGALTPIPLAILGLSGLFRLVVTMAIAAAGCIDSPTCPPEPSVPKVFDPGGYLLVIAALSSPVVALSIGVVRAKLRRRQPEPNPTQATLIKSAGSQRAH